MESSRDRCLRLLVAVETLVEEECFAAARSDWDEVGAAQRRADPVLVDLGALLGGGALLKTDREQLRPRFQLLQRQHAELVAHLEGKKARVAARLAAINAADGRIAGMKRSYGTAVRPAGSSQAPAALRESA